MSIREVIESYHNLSGTETRKFKVKNQIRASQFISKQACIPQSVIAYYQETTNT
jgi:hypothetical protein